MLLYNFNVFLFLPIYATLRYDFDVFFFYLFTLRYVTILTSFLFLSLYTTLRYDFNVFLFFHTTIKVAMQYLYIINATTHFKRIR